MASIESDGVGMTAQKDIDAADWTDQDLLTRDEAGERLNTEIESTRDRLKDLGTRAGEPGVAESIEMHRRRLNAMEALRESL